MKTITLLHDALPLLLKGALVTLQITALALGIGLVFGTIFGTLNAKKIRMKGIAQLIDAYVLVVRGTPVYVQVDSTDHATTYGAVLETHEIAGSPYNNIAGVASTTGTLEPADLGSGDTRPKAGRDGLPRRR